MNRFHTVVATVDNKPGVLARVAGLFARRGYNIESLAVAPTDQDKFSRITFTVDVASSSLEQVVKQLDKLINVVEIHELEPGQSIERELMLVVVEVNAETCHNLMDVVYDFRAHVIDEGNGRIMLALTDRPEQISEFEKHLREYGIIKLQRTGRVAMHTLDATGLH